MLSSNHLCKSCGSVLREYGRFCPKCGTPVGESTSSSKVAVNFQPSHDLRVWLDFKEVLKLYGIFLLISFSHYIFLKFTKNPVGEVLSWIAIGSTTIYYSVRHKTYILDLFKPKLPGLKGLLLIAAVSLGCYIVLTSYFSIFGVFKTESVKYADNILKYSWPLWTAYFLTAVCPAIFEEIAFRGVIYQKLKEFFSVKEALFIQAACFSVLHLMPTIFLSHLIMGLFFGWVRERTNSLLLSILFHFAWNAHIVYLELSK